MRKFQLRTYTLRNQKALDLYRTDIYPRHLNSFPLFGIETHGLWTAVTDDKPRLFVLLSIGAGEAFEEITRRYMQSAELVDDIKGFDPSDIVKVESTFLTPSIGSPLN